MITSPGIKTVPSGPWFTKGRHVALIMIAVFFLLSGTTLYRCYAANLFSLLPEQRFRTLSKTMESYTNRPLLLQAVREKNPGKARMHLASLMKDVPGVESILITDRRGTLWTIYPPAPGVVGAIR